MWAKKEGTAEINTGALCRILNVYRNQRVLSALVSYVILRCLEKGKSCCICHGYPNDPVVRVTVKIIVPIPPLLAAKEADKLFHL